MTRTQTLTKTTNERNLFKIFWLEAKYEFLKTVRIPVYAISTIVFPMMFYVLFGLMFSGDSS